MENASKALLIAGSVLIVILLIAVGMMIYNGARGTVDESVSQMSSQQIEAFNTQFTMVGTTKVTGTQVQSLMEKVEANNLQNPGTEGMDPKCISVTITGGGNVVSTQFYKIDYVKDKVTGLVKSITITKGSDAGSIKTES